MILIMKTVLLNMVYQKEISSELAKRIQLLCEMSGEYTLCKYNFHLMHILFVMKWYHSMIIKQKSYMKALIGASCSTLFSMIY